MNRIVRLILGLAVAAGVGVSCAGLVTPKTAIALPPPGAFLMQTHQTGTVGPRYYRIDTVLVDGQGGWTAVRRFPYSLPPFTTTLATGSLTAAARAQLQNLAVEQPATGDLAFAALPSAIATTAAGAGTRAIAIALPDGQMHGVTVVGAVPPAFARLDSAIASATVDVDTLGPFEAP